MRDARAVSLTALLISTAALLLSAVDAAPTAAQDPIYKTTYVKLGQGEPALLYEPLSPGAKAQIGVFVMHASGDYLTFSACSELSKRGYRVLCANNATSKSGAFEDGIMDRIMLEAKSAVVYLRQYPGIRKVVLFGHSGGATVMTAYQDIAENGLKACQGGEKIHRCPDSLAGLPPADGVVLADANWGQAEMVLLSVDPAVVSEDSGTTLNPDLDMFNPKNGFKPEGSTYSEEFIHKFLVAEGKRNNALIKAAEDRLAAIEAGKGRFLDDEPLVIPGAFVAANKLFAQDVRLLSHSQKPWPLLRPDGSSVTQIIRSVRTPEMTQNPSPYMMRGALKTTVRNFLGSYAIRVTDDFGYGEDSIHGIDWTSTYASPPGDVEGVTAPLLALGMTGHWEGLAAETIYEHAKSTDKTLAFVEGATHMYTPCTKCEKSPGQFGDTVKTTYDFVDRWLGARGRFL